MINLIISGHGEVANGLKSSLSVIAGDFEHITFINFINDAEKLKTDITSAIEKKSGEPFLILTDLVGGTPFKTAALLSKEINNIRVIGGVNLPMLLSIVYDDKSTLDELMTLAVKSGKDGIKEFA